MDDRDGDAAALEDALVCLVHRVVGLVEVGMIGVEAVEVHHAELTAANEAHARARFVAEFGLNLIEQLRQLFVALDVAAEEVCDDLLVRGAESEAALTAVLERHQRWAVIGGAAALLPQLDRREHRHEDLLPAGAVHLLPHDLLDLAQDAPAQRQVAVDTGRDLLDEAGAQQKLVREVLGLLRCFAEGVAEESGHSHRGVILRGSALVGRGYSLGREDVAGA